MLTAIALYLSLRNESPSPPGWLSVSGKQFRSCTIGLVWNPRVLWRCDEGNGAFYDDVIAHSWPLVMNRRKTLHSTYRIPSPSIWIPTHHHSSNPTNTIRHHRYIFVLLTPQHFSLYISDL